jgi:CRISPR-associated protein Csd2
MRHTDPSLRHDFVYVFDVTDGNPNGDPDAGNMPRIDPETMHGLVTDVALKRKVRDYASAVFNLLNGDDLPQALENEIGRYKSMRRQRIFIQSEEALNTLIYRAFKEVGLGSAEVQLDEHLLDVLPKELPEDFVLLEDGKTLVYSGEAVNKREIADEINNLFEEEDRKRFQQDIKKVVDKLTEAVQGTKMDYKEKRKQREEARGKLTEDYYDVRMFGAVMSTGLNAGQVRGPMQITFARSVDPILPMDLTITRQARTTVERMGTGTTEMGRKSIVPYGLYKAHGFFNPMLAEKVTENDLALFWDALLNMFELDRSASRGQMACRGLYVFSHDNPLGNAHAHKLFERIKIQRRPGVDPPRSFDDYVVEVDESDMPQGVTLKSIWD